MDRRGFLKMSGTGLAAVAVGGAGGWSLFGPAAAVASTVAFDLEMEKVEAEMVDGRLVDMWAYSTPLKPDGAPQSLGARIPGPTIFATEGDTVRITVRNKIANGGPHSFSIPGVVDSGPLAVGQERLLEFAAPRAGTYMYLDALNAPVNRVMGLHGALIVLPNPVGNPTPYSNATTNVRRLFEDLGVAAKGFPGHPWDPDRNVLWVFSTVDPDWNNFAAAQPGAISAAAITATKQGDPAARGRYLPQYFTINGKSGFFAAQHGAGPASHSFHGRSIDAQKEISIHGNVGQPCLIRSMNAGLMWQSPHIHGNHVYRLTDGETIETNLHFVDTWTSAPASRVDVLLPYFQPPDIPPAKWPPVDEKFPLVYPMHDHNEISNTAAGGNYPQGCATHFQFDGDLQADDEVISVDKAELRARTGQIEISGRISGMDLRPPGSPGREIMLHHAHGLGEELGAVTCGADGRFSIRLRAREALATRDVMLMGPNLAPPTDPPIRAARTVRLKHR